MVGLDTVSLRISNYKCFGADEYGYDRILPINLIIGRNNSGKSTLLDLVEYITAPKSLDDLGHDGNTPLVLLSDFLNEDKLRKVFPNANGGSIPGNHWEFGQQWIGKPITWAVKHNGIDFIKVDPPFGINNLFEYELNLAREMGNPFGHFNFKRLLADRDIAPEKDDHPPKIQSNGEGVTNAIQNFINSASLTSSVVEDIFLSELNHIFEPDGSFTDIVIQKLGDGRWEIYLEENEKGRIPLSHTGSGLKTIILVLAFLHLIPRLEDKKISTYLFGFEELENNLHPALQRRLLLYLREIAISQGCRFFLTTHSNVAIDLFSSDDKAQILHVTHNRKCAAVKRVQTYIENKGILDDLDVRASDILQANGVVWLEGPSDRLYFNRWVELWTDGELKEGFHYQCIFYGGRLLAHLSASDPDINPDDVVKILNVNRNALLLIDSDRSPTKRQINATKQRLITEIESFGGKAWLTSGKEVENYIPTSALSSYYSKPNLPSPKQYQNFSGYLDKIKADEGKRFLRQKVLFAERICPYLTKDELVKVFDWDHQISETCNIIRKWNNL